MFKSRSLQISQKDKITGDDGKTFFYRLSLDDRQFTIKKSRMRNLGVTKTRYARGDGPDAVAVRRDERGQIVMGRGAFKTVVEGSDGTADL